MALIETATAATTTTTATSVTVTLAGAPTAGEKLVAVVHSTDDYPDTPSGWTLDKEKAGTGVIRLFSKTASGSEGTSLVFTAPSASGMTARVMRFSGLGAIDSSATGATSGTGTFNTGFLTTTQASTFLIAAGSPHATTLPSDDVAPSSGFTKIAADIKSTNSGNRSQLHVSTGTAATITSYDFTGTYTPTASTSAESVLVAYATVSGDATVTAVRATGSGAAGTPSVSTGSSNGTVTAVRAVGSGVAQPPTVDVVTTLTGGGPATGTGQAIVPSVSVIGGPGSVQAVKATGTGVARPPVVTGTTVTNATVSAVRAAGAGTANPPGVALVETLPSNVGTGRVTFRVGEAKVLVGDADGVANLYPYAGETITFTSTAPVLLDATATPVPLTIIPKPIVCTTDTNGYMVDAAGHQYVDLIATNDTDLTPSTRKYRVTFSPGLGISSFDMPVLLGATVDLLTLIPT
jgi:hypothetical protein